MGNPSASSLSVNHFKSVDMKHGAMQCGDLPLSEKQPLQYEQEIKIALGQVTR